MWKGDFRMTDHYQAVTELLEANFQEIDGYDFYQYIFPNNESQGEWNTDFSKPNAIYLYRDPADQGTRRTLRRRIMLADTWKEDYLEYVERNPMTLCSGLTYRQRTNKLVNAQQMNALIFDLDNVGEKELKTLFLRFGKPAEMLRTLPTPTFLVASGKGLHLYYVFQEPIDLYPNIKVQLKSLKYDLTFRIWDYKSTSQAKQIQYQSINQGFRMVGSVNDKYGAVVRAYQVGGRVSLDDLNPYAQEKNRVDIKKPFRPTKITLEEAREKYPDWYQRVVVEKNRNQKKWDIKGKVHGDNPYALYDWWKKRAGEIKGGHRYFFLMCMAIYACKCDVPKKQLKRDMQEVFQELQQVEHDNPLRTEDITSALEAYDKEYYNFTIDDISKLTDLFIQKNKRNGRKQADHLGRARVVQNYDDPDGNWRNKNGRPSAEQKVREWRRVHPEGKKIDCHRETGLSRVTIDKWWEAPKPELEEPKNKIPEYIPDDWGAWLYDLDPRSIYYEERIKRKEEAEWRMQKLGITGVEWWEFDKNPDQFITEARKNQPYIPHSDLAKYYEERDKMSGYSMWKENKSIYTEEFYKEQEKRQQLEELEQELKRIKEEQEMEKKKARKFRWPFNKKD